MKSKVCHMSTAHLPDDIRIYRKEAMSLSTKYEVTMLVANNDTNKELKDVDLLSVPKSNNRLGRFTVDPYRMYKQALKMDYDVYHFHDIELLLYGYLLKRRGKTVIYDIHEDLPRAIVSKKWIPKLLRRTTKTLVELFENYFASKMSYLITATPFIKQRFIKINSNTEVINNYPLKNELFEFNVSSSKKKQVAYVGGLSAMRGLDQLAEASNLTNNIIKVAGRVGNTNVKNQLDTVGQISRDEVKQLLSESVAGIVTFLPEPNHINARPNKMFEYMSASLPVICSNFESWNQLIDESKFGKTVDPLNPKEIADAIDYFINNPELSRSYGENGRKAVDEKYNWEKESEKLFDIYNKLLGVS